MTTKPRSYGYDGGDSEGELIKAANAALDGDQADSIEKIREVYWKVGAILTTAIARGYTKALGIRGWIVTNLHCSHTHGYACMKAWKTRDSFDDALRWYQSKNTGWRPTKATGPTFAIELVNAYKDRNKSEQDRLSAATRKKDAASKKELLGQVAIWKSRYARLREEARKLSQYAKREPIVLNAIEQEIAVEAGGEPESVKSALHSDERTEPSPGPKTKPAAKRKARNAKRQSTPTQYGSLLEDDGQSERAATS